MGKVNFPLRIFILVGELRHSHRMEATEDGAFYEALSSVWNYLHVEHAGEYPELERILSCPNSSNICTFSRWKPFHPFKYLLKFIQEDPEHQEHVFRMNQEENLSVSHPVFRYIRAFIRKWEVFYEESNYTPIKTLIVTYNSTISTIIQCSPPRRHTLLEQGTVIKENLQCFRISQEHALVMLSLNIFRLSTQSSEQKKAMNATHRVVKMGDVFYKVSDGISMLEPANEKLVYFLSQLLDDTESYTVKSDFLCMDGIKFTTYKTEPELVEHLNKGNSVGDYLEQHLEANLTATTATEKFFLQESNAIPGIEVYDLFYEPGGPNSSASVETDPHDFDLLHFGVQVVLTLLLKPHDGKGENFKVFTENGKKKFVGIDNDRIFAAVVYKDKQHLSQLAEEKDALTCEWNCEMRF